MNFCCYRYFCNYGLCFCFHFILTVSIRSENFATIPLGFQEPSISNKWVQYFQMKVTHAYLIIYDGKVMIKLRKKIISGSFLEYWNYKKKWFWLIPPKDAELNFRRGPRGNFPLMDSYKPYYMAHINSTPAVGQQNRWFTAGMLHIKRYLWFKFYALWLWKA